MCAVSAMEQGFNRQSKLRFTKKKSGRNGTLAKVTLTQEKRKGMDDEQCKTLLAHVINVNKQQEEDQRDLIKHSQGLINRGFWLLIGVVVTGQFGMMGSLFYQQSNLDRYINRQDRREENQLRNRLEESEPNQDTR